ncbi:unnamed protein product, partial [Adineta steineri]
MKAPAGAITVSGINSAKAIGTAGGRRRRRDIQCDQSTRSGTALNFGIILNYPPDLSCQTPSCVITLFTYIHNQFNSVKNVAITADDGSSISVDLCHVESHPDGDLGDIDDYDGGT